MSPPNLHVVAPSVGSHIQQLIAQMKNHGSSMVADYIQKANELEKLGAEIVEAGEAIPFAIRNDVLHHGKATRSVINSISVIQARR
jgi:hypothetical protein